MYIYIYNMYPTANAKTCKLANPDSTFLPSHLNPKSIYSIFRRIRLSLKSWIGFVWAELEFQPDSREGVVSLGKLPCGGVENWKGEASQGQGVWSGETDLRRISLQMNMTDKELQSYFPRTLLGEAFGVPALLNCFHCLCCIWTQSFSLIFIFNSFPNHLQGVH